MTVLYPLFADLANRTVLVVGGGAVAERKIAALRKAGAQIRIDAPRVTATLAEWSRLGHVAWSAAMFEPASLDGVWLVIAATGNRTVNAQVAALAGTRRILVNVVDDADLSSFHVPAIVDRAPVLIAISSGGTAPLLARRLREQLERTLDHALGPLAALLGRYRHVIRSVQPSLPARRRLLESLIDGPVARLLRAARPKAAERVLRAALARRERTSSPGSVVLVGAGPGDPGLLTLHGLRALNDADVIVHDRLVSTAILDLARRDALRIDVGKRPGEHGVGQTAIHHILLEHARTGRRVVRLKGGDPFMFGRGGEEIEFLRDHGIACEVVPGITAAIACAAYAGIPLTHREHAQSVRFLTAHCKQSLDTLDWAALAAERQTLAVYMGVSELGTLQRHLIEHGRAAGTPFALVENGTLVIQRVITGTLGQLAARAIEYDVKSPAMLILGEVAALVPRLAWFGDVAADNPASAAAAA